MSAPPKISMRGVTKSFDGRKVLDGVDIDVAQGRSLVIIGGSGQGKSVTLKCLLGLLRPDAGTIEVDGEDVVSLSARARETLMRKFGMLFQSAALFDSLSVWENVAFRLLHADKTPKREARDRAVQALEHVNLSPDIAELAPDALSGGMRKRVGLARAIVAEPEILLFDEPTTGLDPINADVINELISRLVRELGATAISITHDMASARKIADEIAMLHEGRIIWRGPAEAIDDSGDARVAQFIEGRAEGPIRT